jgi:hypothetical protein
VYRRSSAVRSTFSYDILGQILDPHQPALERINDHLGAVAQAWFSSTLAQAKTVRYDAE